MRARVGLGARHYGHLHPLRQVDSSKFSCATLQHASFLVRVDWSRDIMVKCVFRSQCQLAICGSDSLKPWSVAVQLGIGWDCSSLPPRFHAIVELLKAGEWNAICEARQDVFCIIQKKNKVVQVSFSDSSCHSKFVFLCAMLFWWVSPQHYNSE